MNSHIVVAENLTITIVKEETRKFYYVFDGRNGDYYECTNPIYYV